MIDTCPSDTAFTKVNILTAIHLHQGPFMVFVSMLTFIVFLVSV